MVVRLMLLCGALFCVQFASAQAVGSWTYNTKGSDYYYAATVNESGNVLGQYCFLEDASCLYLISFTQGCKMGESYPVLVNTSENGSSHQNLRCGEKVDGKSVLVFDDFKAIDSSIRGAKKIGIAIPLQGDGFIVGRFILDGAATAMDRMRAAVERRTQPARQTGTKDQRL